MPEEGIEQEITQEETEQEQRIREAINEETGDWKSLGHRKQFYNEEIPPAPDAPNPFAYEADQEEKFNSDLFFYRQRENVKEAIKETLPPPPAQPLITSPDLRKEIEEEERLARLYKDITLLGESSLDDKPEWQNPYFQREVERELNAFNTENKRGLIVLPAEQGEWGNTKKIKPSDMVFFELPKDVHARILYVSQNFNNKGRNKFEAMWAALRKAGYASNAQPTVKYLQSESKSSEETKKKKNPDDPWGSQKEFEKWRMKNGAKR